MKQIELLAPAGSFEKAKIAFLYGADAVYCGTSSLSLRTRADMENDDLAKTIKYAHSINKKVYVTLNIYAWDEKYEEIIVHCGSGITGTVNYMFMEEIGLRPRLYAGGYSDWVSYEGNKVISKDNKEVIIE